MTATPLLTASVGMGYNTYKLAQSLTEWDELCQCGRTKDNQEHFDWCQDGFRERWAKRFTYRKHQYMTLEEETMNVEGVAV